MLREKPLSERERLLDSELADRPRATGEYMASPAAVAAIASLVVVIAFTVIVAVAVALAAVLLAVEAQPSAPG
ncbi:MAG: hypothetical protein Kow0010_27100 [Dehalococcoidia bacterium]